MKGQVACLAGASQDLLLRLGASQQTETVAAWVNEVAAVGHQH